MKQDRLHRISILLVCLLALSPLSSLAMQHAAAPSEPEHCEQPQDDYSLPTHNNAKCSMSDCNEDCSGVRICSGQTPMLLCLQANRTDTCPTGFCTSQSHANHPSVHPPDLFRPPRA